LVRLPAAPRSTLFPYTTLFRSNAIECSWALLTNLENEPLSREKSLINSCSLFFAAASIRSAHLCIGFKLFLISRCVPVLFTCTRSEEHTSELQSRENLVCRLLL